MAIEVEKKYRLNHSQIQLIIDSLGELGAKFEGEDFEENILFLGGELLGKDAALRLRRIAEKTILTYKQRVQSDSSAKQQIEYETEVADFDEIANIFEALGYRRSVVYEKRRRTWKFRQVEIVLDALPFGDFMEIEGSVMAIAEAEYLLEAEDFEVEHQTYPNLTLLHGKRNGDLVEARFD